MLPIIKYVGGKRKYVKEIEVFWKKSKATRLVELFCGSAAISLGLEPGNVLLNDINPDLINFYNYISCHEIDCLMLNDEQFYYRSRDEFNTLDRENPEHNKRLAELFSYLIQTGYNGLIRYNKKGDFNTPFGHYKNIKYRKYFPEFMALTKNWKITNIDFSEVQIQPGDFLFVDPPYWAGYVDYCKDGFTWGDQERLAIYLSQQSVPIIATNTWCKEIIDLYKDVGFDVRIRSRHTSISCTTKKRGYVDEAFILKI